MQANYVAQYQTAGKIPAVDNLGFTQKNKSFIDSAFAELFSNLQQFQNTGSYPGSMQEMTSNTSFQMLSRNVTDQSGQPNEGYQDADGENKIAQSQSKEMESQPSKEADRPPEDAQSISAGEEGHDDNTIGEKSAEAGGQVTQTGEEGLFMQADDSAAMNAVAEITAMLNQRLAEDARTQDVNLTAETRKKLTTILQELKAATSLEDSKTALAKLAELLKNNSGQELSDGAKLSAKQGESFAKDLRSMLALIDPNYKMEVKKGSRESQIEKEARSNSNLSSLESATSAFARQKLKSEQGNEEKNQNNSKDTSLKPSHTESRNTAAGSADKNVSSHSSEVSGSQKTEGSTFKKTLTAEELRADAGIHLTKQGQAAGNVDKTAKQSANQEAVIKNFQDVKALLDKQLLQVKETSSSSMSIKLNPQELGKINIQLELLDNGKLQGKIFVENEITRNSLQQHAEALKEQIKAQGVSLESFEINLGSENPQQRSGEFQQQGRFDRQSEKSRQDAYSEFRYEEEMSDQLQSALSQTIPVSSGINVLA